MIGRRFAVRPVTRAFFVASSRLQRFNNYGVVAGPDDLGESELIVFDVVENRDKEAVENL